jgi:phage-related protein
MLSLFRIVLGVSPKKKGLDNSYKNLYSSTVTSKGSETRIKWEGDSNEEIRTWPKNVRADIGLELDRLDNYETPLKSKSMGDVLPGVRELLEQDEALWYRLFYWLHEGWIYILHCFNKKTNKTSKSDIKVAKDRVKAVKQRGDAPFEKEEGEEEKKSA